MKTWLITGASRGLGLETARAALAAGDQVVATGRNPRTIESALGAGRDRLLSVALDVTDPGSVAAAVEDAKAHFGRIDILVNNAGYGQLGAFEEISQDAIEQQFETNVFGVFRVTRAVLPVMRAQRSGHIMTISSMVGIVGVKGGSIYCASKFAVAGWSEALNVELARFGIRATVVHPGYFRTDFLDRSSVRHADLSIDDYRPSTGGTAKRANSHDRRQLGDPAAFGRTMVELANASEPPVRFAAGTDAVKVMHEKGTALQESAATWHALSVSTDFAD
jgi:NAD(P)-dependent dehydrogenase (short-subunit alcohol dehydrogenase family)